MATGASVNMSGSGVLDPRIRKVNDAEFPGIMNMTGGDRATTSISTDQNPSITEAQGDYRKYMGELPGNIDFAARKSAEQMRDLTEGIRKSTMGNIAKTGAGLQSGAALLSLGKVDAEAARAAQDASTKMLMQGREQYGNLLAQKAGLAGTAASNQVSMTGMQNELLRTQQAQQQAQAQLAMQQQQLELEKERLRQQVELDKLKLAQQAAIAGVGQTGAAVGSGPGGGLQPFSPYTQNRSASGRIANFGTNVLG